MIPVPIGSRHYLSLEANIVKEVQCAECGCDFVYSGTRRVTVSLFNPFDALTSRYVRQRLQPKAQRKLEREIQRPEHVACPQCGAYQPDMVAEMQTRRRTIGLVGLACAAPVAVFGAFVVHEVLFWPWLLLIGLLAALFGSMLAAIMLLPRLFDPNHAAPDVLLERAEVTKAFTREAYHQQLLAAEQQKLANASQPVDFSFLKERRPR